MIDAILIGAGATAFLDLWSVAQARLFGSAKPNYALVGRWLAHMTRGRFFHDSIARSEPVKGELLIGWVAHYLIGIAFPAALLVGLGAAACDPEIDRLTTPTVIPVNGEGAAGIGESVDASVIAFLTENDLPGATVAVTRGGRLVWSKSYGWAKRSEQLPMQPWHRSRIGSVSKVITTIGLLQMLEEPGPALGSLAAEKGALIVPTRPGDAADNLFGHDRREAARGQIVEKEQGTGALDEDVVDAVIYQIDADRVVHAAHERDFELGAHAVSACDEHRVGHGITEGEQAAEGSDT